ncbi:MAG: peptidase C1 [Bacteroidetes bacterium]|nr:peptidase C1 [Bacteroidota bacterium]
MPIRMEKDDPQPSRGGGGGKRGGNFLIRLLPLIIMFLIKRPKLLIPALLIGGAWYFFFGGSELLSSGPAPVNDNTTAFSIGATLDPEEYDKAKVFEPLATGLSGQSGLPKRVSLASYAPRRLHQGRQGSCVGWASAYAARSILEAQTTGQSPDQVAFSPSYLYNQIALQGCQGAYMRNAMQTMQQYGSLPFREFRYNESSCNQRPSQQQKQAGQRYRIQGYDRLTLGANNLKPDLLGIKQHIAQGYPVVVGMMVGGSFMQGMMGRKLWNPSSRDYGMRGFGGHAMCVIGYNDEYYGGAFQIMNSWGPEWGDDGIAWVRYKDFKHFTKEAYGVYPVASAKDQSKLAVEFGLLDVDAQQTIGLQRQDDLSFRTAKPIGKGDKFKVLIANSIDCYIYVFGQETDGSSYVLFPYTDKHSPYCGITGTRLFPRDYSMVADDIGNQDYIAIVVSKKELDFNALNKKLSRSRASTYADKLQEALGSQRVRQLQFKDSQNVAFEADTGSGGSAVGVVIAIDKR